MLKNIIFANIGEKHRAKRYRNTNIIHRKKINFLFKHW